MATFPAVERLKSRKLLQQVYADGRSVKQYPFRLKYLRQELHDSKVKIAISVPKRKVKKAVGRNRLKRQIKEAYRLNKSHIFDYLQNEKEGLALFLIYTGEEGIKYKDLEIGIQKLIKKLLDQL